MAFDALNLPTETSLQPVAFTRKSRNGKVGPIPVTTSGEKTCPPACPLKGAGCYADGGPLAIFWRKVTASPENHKFADLLEQIEALPAGQLWRHNQAGDLQPRPENTDLLDHAALMDLALANIGRRGFTYTHYDPIAYPENARSIAAANRAGFTVNLSGNNPGHADDLADQDCGPVVTVLPQEYERKNKKGEWQESLVDYKARLEALPMATPKGRTIAVCPATFTDTNCKACQLCQRQQRKAIVGFPAHGFRTRKANDIAAQGGN